MAQPDISSILAALAQQNQAGTPQTSATPHQPPPMQHPMYNMGVAQPPSAPPGAYLPQPSSTGSLDLSAIRPVNSGAVSIQEAIAKAKGIAADRGVSSYDPRSASPRDDPREGARGGMRRSRSRSPPRRGGDGYNNPYRDERREDPRRGSYRNRSPSPDRNFRGQRDTSASHRSNDGGETETIRVKSSLVGLIIGRSGENLRKVESETGARVQFLQAKDSHTPERQCTITGSTRSREAAKTAIFSIVEENGGNDGPSNGMQEKGSYTAGMPGRAKVNLPALREGENKTEIMVPDKTVGLIIGRGGETIKDLQERSGCHVNILGENKSVNGLRPINLIGSAESTRLAKDLILEIVESDNRGTATNPPAAAPRDRGGFDNYSRGGGRGGDTVSKTIQVPSEAVGMIIGKGGETIKDLQRTTGCKINVNSPKAPDVTRNIDLEGDAHAMDAAERAIWDKVDTVKQRDAAAGGRGGRGGGGGDRDQRSRYDAGGYSQQQQPQAASGYGQYMPQQQAAQPQALPFQMPAIQQQSTPAQSEMTPEQQAAYQAFYAQWYASQLQANNYGQSGAPPGS